MSNHSEAQDTYSPGPFARFKNWVMGQEEFDDEAEVEEPVAGTERVRPVVAEAPVVRGQHTTLRMEQARASSITVRRSVHGFEDARRAADGLKQGQQQIINLEQTPADMAQRVVDFLNGATHAVDGSVEKIGEQVYLFTPRSVTIDVDDKASMSARPSFLDR